MNKEFIPFELALKLKELGFDEECFGFYDAYNGDNHLLLNDRYEPIWLLRTWLRIFFKKYQETTFVSQSYVEYINGVCLAPTFSQAFRFFREKYELEPYIRGRKSMGYEFIIGDVPIHNSRGKDSEFSKLIYNNYEEAELECLKKLIKIVKNENKNSNKQRKFFN